MIRLLFLLFFLITLQSLAQKDAKTTSLKRDSVLKDTVGPYYQKLADNLNKVVDAFSHNFNTIQGKKLNSNPKIATWYSKIIIPECEQGLIYQEPTAGNEKWVYKARLLR